MIGKLTLGSLPEVPLLALVSWVSLTCSTAPQDLPVFPRGGKHWLLGLRRSLCLLHLCVKEAVWQVSVGAGSELGALKGKEGRRTGKSHKGLEDGEGV